jgi:hypothetical protein
MRDIVPNLTPAEKQRIAWQLWYSTHKDEYNLKKSRERDKKKGYIANDGKHRKRADPPHDPAIKVNPPKPPPKPKISATEARRRKIALDLEKVEARRAEWRVSQQNSTLDQTVSSPEARP